MKNFIVFSTGKETTNVIFYAFFSDSAIWQGDDSYFSRDDGRIVARKRKCEGRKIKPSLSKKDIQLIKKIFEETPAKNISIRMYGDITKMTLLLSRKISAVTVHQKVYPLLNPKAFSGEIKYCI